MALEPPPTQAMMAVGQAVFLLENLRAGFAADDAMEVADHGGVGVRAEDAAEEVVGGADVGDPVAHGFVDGVFEGARAGGDAADLRAEHAHAEDVELLAAHVFFAHVDDAVEAEEGADGGGGDAVLAGAGFRDDAFLAHAHSKERLAEAVVDFVRAGVEQVFALEIDVCAAEGFCEARGEVERGGAAGVVAQQRVELQVEIGVSLGLGIGVLQLVERGDEGLGNVAAAVGAEASCDAIGHSGCHDSTLHRAHSSGEHGRRLDFEEGEASRADEVVEEFRVFFAG